MSHDGPAGALSIAGAGMIESPNTSAARRFTSFAVTGAVSGRGRIAVGSAASGVACCAARTAVSAGAGIGTGATTGADWGAVTGRLTDGPAHAAAKTTAAVATGDRNSAS